MSKATKGVLGFPRLVPFSSSAPDTETEGREAEGNRAGAADAPGTFSTQRLGSHSRRRSPTC